MVKLTTYTNKKNLNISLLLAILIMTHFPLHAADLEIIEVKRNITLSDDEKIYKDYFISQPQGHSLKKNLIVKAIRKSTIKNNAQKIIGEFHSVVGQLKIIHVEGSIAIAREFKYQSRDNEPMIDQPGFMIGDTIDLSDSFIDNKVK